MGRELELKSNCSYQISKDGIAKFHGIYINPDSSSITAGGTFGEIEKLALEDFENLKVKEITCQK